VQGHEGKAISMIGLTGFNAVRERKNCAEQKDDADEDEHEQNFHTQARPRTISALHSTMAIELTGMTMAAMSGDIVPFAATLNMTKL
jgi:hypothetical protein